MFYKKNAFFLILYDTHHMLLCKVSFIPCTFFKIENDTHHLLYERKYEIINQFVQLYFHFNLDLWLYFPIQRS